MFKFLKDKLSKAASIFSKKVEEEGEINREVVPNKVSEPQTQVSDVQAIIDSAEDVSEDAVVESTEFTGNQILQPEDLEEIVVEEQQQVPSETAQDTEETSYEIFAEDESNSESQAVETIDDFAEKEKLALEKEAEEARLREEQAAEEEKAKLLLEEQARIELAKKQEEREHEMLEVRRRQQEEEEARRQAAVLKEAEEKRKEEALKVAEEKKPKTGFFKKLFGKKEDNWEKVEKPSMVLEKEEFEKVKEDYTVVEEESPVKSVESKQIKPVIQKPVLVEEEETESKGFFGKIKESITSVKLSEDKFNDLFWDMELGMLENNVAVEVIEKVKEDLKRDLTSGKVARSSVEQIVQESLRKSFESLFSEAQGFDLVDRVKSGKKPFVIAFIGVNGSGKTTTMAKVASLLKKNGLSMVFAASDTFRAAAMQQLQEHADKLGIKMIKHDYESDPAAVAFDAVKHAEAKGIDVVLIDTAGRLHTNDNLMNELKKLIRVNKPDLKIFIGESITGNDCVEQAKLFNEAVGIDAIILAKADVDEKGGAAISVSYVTKKPILYLGTGQTYDDLTKFDSEAIIKNIGL